ncbi:MAG: mechanosensitive ion channel, partial [Psychroserpens sp.]|nr:mechanosensitive ion channel [Psychroserpens sp.]
MKHYLYDILVDKGISEHLAIYLNMIGLLVVLLLAVFIIDYITKRLLWRFFAGIARRTKTNFDNILIENKLPRKVAHIIPLLILIEFIPDVLSDFQNTEIIVEKVLKVVGILLTLQIVRSFLLSVRDYLKTLERYKDKPLYSYIQVFMIFLWVIAIAAIFAIVTGVTYWRFFAGIGTASAVIILVFRDSILGFVASIQVTVNDMVRIGDWITFDKYGADGNVTEITLATVKVQNWDKTITTIPTYALISDSFKNWRGMTNSGGRRIKRSVIIKASSIKFLTDADVKRFKKIQLISDYIDDRIKVIDEYNSMQNADKSVLINGRNLTNFGVFRKYLKNYMDNHSAINKDMTLMVRQLEQTSQGIPMEIYAFSSDQR